MSGTPAAGRGQLEDERAQGLGRRARQDHAGRRRPVDQGRPDDLPAGDPDHDALPMARSARKIAIGGQDCHAEPSGAFTGDISAEMLADAGASAVIVGHSERRTLHKETDAEVRAKAKAAWRAGLMAIVCVGETRAEREAGQTLDVLGRQLARLAARRRDRGEPGGRLRAGLGDRHRPDADARRRGGGARLHPHAAGRALRRSRGRRCASSTAARSSPPTPRS